MIRSKSSAAFTLVELLIALGLMAILVTAIAQVFTGAQKIFGETDAKVLLYQNVRIMFDQMERDFSNCEKTYQMEFFNDTSPNNGVYDGIQERIADLAEYDYAPYFEQFIYQDAANNNHRADEMYFKTLATYRGETRLVLVHYQLRYEGDSGQKLPYPVLERKLRYVEEVDNSVVELNPAWEIGGRYNYLTDIQVQVYYADRRKKIAGQYYSPGDLASTTSDHKLHLYGSEDKRVNCFYEGKDDGNIILISNQNSDILEHGVVSKTFNRFGLLGPGDRMLVVFDDPNSNQQVKKSMIIHDLFELDGNANFLGITFTGSLELQTSDSDINCDYYAAWLPPSIKVTCRVIDSTSKRNRIVSRVFRLLRS